MTSSRWKQAWRALRGRDYERELREADAAIDDGTRAFKNLRSQLNEVRSAINGPREQAIVIRTRVEPGGPIGIDCIRAGIEWHVVEVPKEFAKRSGPTREMQTQFSDSLRVGGMPTSTVRDHIAIMGRRLGQDFVDIYLKEFADDVCAALGVR